MSDPIVFISHFKVKPGKLESLKHLNQKVTEQIKTSKPSTVAFLQYLDEQGEELSIIHVFPDAESFDRHVEGAERRAKTSMDFVEPTRREVYGMPNDQVLAMLKPRDGSGIAFHIMAKASSGYIRLGGG